MSKISFAQRIKNLFSLHKNQNDDFFDELLDALIEGDVGAKNSMQIVDRLQAECKEGRISTQDEILLRLKNILLESVKGVQFVPEKTKQIYG